MSATRLRRRQALLLASAAGVAAIAGLMASPRVAATVAPPMPPEVNAALPGARLRGSGRLTFLGLHVYDARLWVAEGFDPLVYAQHPVVLELAYARRLVGRQIAERSLKEMQRVPGISSEQADAWLAEMLQAFPDVAKDDRLSGVYRPGEGIRFYLNGQRRREVRDADFARRFVGIWLAQQTSQPQLREALLGSGRA